MYKKKEELTVSSWKKNISLTKNIQIINFHFLKNSEYKRCSSTKENKICALDICSVDYFEGHKKTHSSRKGHHQRPYL